MSKILKQPQQCLICSELKVYIELNLSDCEHTGICIQCAQNNFQSQISQNKIPVCFQEGCGKYIKQNKYFELKKNSELKKIKQSKLQKDIKIQNKMKDCKVPDCQGSIINNQCKKCSTRYCYKCLSFDHPLSQPCIFDSAIENITNTQCPNCKSKFQKYGGCPKLKCPSCNFQYCFVCKKNWSFDHHRCQNYKTLKNKARSIFCCCFSSKKIYVDSHQ